MIQLPRWSVETDESGCVRLLDPDGRARAHTVSLDLAETICASLNRLEEKRRHEDKARAYSEEDRDNG